MCKQKLICFLIAEQYTIIYKIKKERKSFPRRRDEIPKNKTQLEMFPVEFTKTHVWAM